MSTDSWGPSDPPERYRNNGIGCGGSASCCSREHTSTSFDFGGYNNCLSGYN
jgi:hypothetical protein